MRTRVALAVVAAIAVVAGGCSLVGGGDDSYHLTVHFSRAVALYEESRVRVMGMDAGTIEEVEPEGDSVRVRIAVNGDIPVPADVQAAIIPQSLIGERNVVLFPPWHEGQARAEDGDVIPPERTEVPVEPDEALQAFTDLARGLNPEEIERLIHEGAETLGGRGDLMNDALAEFGDLSQLIGREDDALVGASEDLNELAGTLNTREEQLGNVLDAFAEATGVLADERGQIEELLGGLATLASAGDDLLAAHEDHLPEDLAQLSQTARTAETNLEGIALFVQALRDNSVGLIGAHNTELNVLTQRINLTPITAEVLRPLFEALGVPVPVPCVPGPGTSCP
jgi:phospholipid/cholesterol/gamma-HCH transport system substrate-binding protein